MKKCISIIFFFSFILFTYYAFSGTTSLTTYYPPPTAAYNKVQLSTTVTSSQTQTVTNSVNCSLPANNGALFVDGNGNLNVCIGLSAVSYPQQCYNSFCSYDQTKPGVTKPENSTCASFLTNPCHSQSGFNYLQAVDSPQPPLPRTTHSYDVFVTAPNNTVVSMLCCSGTNGVIASSSSGSGSTLPGGGTTIPPNNS